MLEDLKKFWDENQLVCGAFLGSTITGLIVRRYCIPVWRANRMLAQAFNEAGGNFTRVDGGYNIVEFVRK
jgi:hypothetical protein